VLTMLKAADVLGDPGGRYSAAAAAAGEDIWRRGLLKKVNAESRKLQASCCKISLVAWPPAVVAGSVQRGSPAYCGDSYVPVQCNKSAGTELCKFETTSWRA
jgi:hypothetical protein